ncbi:MAG: cyclodeaminase/cyclohydrolase family protein [Candidatus Omnitrophica bacterium]|nr:cyclodeaminase/cyclohydrolase family protein [Candidatus Omnitrophota bacterium]
MYKNALKKYLDDLASKLPAPGGGSAAALTAATGTALLSMVANFTLGKEKYKAVQGEIKEILFSAESLREKLMQLVDQDIVAYKKLSSAYKLPKESTEDKKKRSLAIEQGLKEALGTPLEICKCCHKAVKLCPALAKKGNSNLISDVGVASLLLQSAFESALLNVDINLKYIKQQEFIVEVREIIGPMQKELSAISQEVIKEVKDNLLNC